MRDKYAGFARNPRGHFPYPIGAASALSLGYDPKLVALVPPMVAERFVGVGNPLSLAELKPGSSVLDIGCGCGFDCFVAAQVAGASGRVIGVDLTREMLDLARDAAGRMAGQGGWAPIDFAQASAEMLPFRDGEFDAVISNGAMNLVPDKGRAFAQVFRVLRPGGRFAFADLLLDEEAAPASTNDPADWAT